MPQGRGPQVTERDVEILQWIGKHGVVTPAQVGRHAFTRDNGTVGQWAAYRRLRILEELNLIREDQGFWGQFSVLRLTGSGARIADVDVGPARLVVAAVRHELAVVDVVEALLAKSPKGTTVTTARELRSARRRGASDRLARPWRGHVPDAVLTLPNRTRVAIHFDAASRHSANTSSRARLHVSVDVTAAAAPLRAVPGYRRRLERTYEALVDRALTEALSVPRIGSVTV